MGPGLSCPSVVMDERIGFGRSSRVSTAGQPSTAFAGVASPLRCIALGLSSLATEWLVGPSISCPCIVMDRRASFSFLRNGSSVIDFLYIKEDLG
jgi:hypothetical protein